MKTSHLYIPIYSFTIILSAALLFSVQPMFSKMILPLLGGTSQVWNTSMLFFQTCLLLGYAYAHLTTKLLSIRTQSVIHIALLSLFFLSLPFGLSSNLSPPYEGNTPFWQIGVMITAIGGPFFLISASAPMLQIWFSYTKHKDAKNPYFLYSASNLGSITALLAYPFIIEPLLNLFTQSQIWSYGYALLTLCFLFCILLVWKTPKQQKLENYKQEVTNKDVKWTKRIKWLILSFIPSSLMLGLTTYITTDIASVPLIWIVPLTLYILTFVIVFARRPLISNVTSVYIACVSLILLIASQILQGFNQPSGYSGMLLHLCCFFFISLACHGSLASIKPQKKHLTEFYLLLSLGGALGGFFNAIIAPIVFTYPLEYPLILGLSSLAIFIGHKTSPFTGLMHKTTIPKLITSKENSFYISIVIFWLFAMGFVDNQTIRLIASIVCALLMFSTLNARYTFSLCVVSMLTAPILISYTGIISSNQSVNVHRNYFGIKRVIERSVGDYEISYLTHGTTVHGVQIKNKSEQQTQTTYYTEEGPHGDVMRILESLDTNHRAAIIGLGVGTLACYTSPKRHYDFYEIDQDVYDIARDTNHFHFLDKCANQYKTYIGDGRFEIQKQDDNIYDAIFIDAFSSDNIPIHLITLEAVNLYTTKLKENGLISFHITNRHLKLEPVMYNVALKLGYTSLVKLKKATNNDAFESTTVVAVLTKNRDYIDGLLKQGWRKTETTTGFKTWTDSYSNIFSVLKLNKDKN